MSQIKIKQHDITDCGAACLASVAAHYRLHFPLARIRQYAGTDQKGTNLLGLIEAAKKLGFQAKGVRAEVKHLFKIPLPVIAHVVLKNGLHHYVVVYKATPKTLEVMDPGCGEMETYSVAAFDEIWSGALLMLLPQEDFIPRNEKVSVYQRFWYLLRPHRSLLMQCFIWSSAYHAFGLGSGHLHPKTYRFCFTALQSPFGQSTRCNLPLCLTFSSPAFGIQRYFPHQNWAANRCQINFGLLPAFTSSSAKFF